MIPKVLSWGIEYLISPPNKFDLQGITLLTEVSELDLRVAAMKSTQSTQVLPWQVKSLSTQVTLNKLFSTANKKTSQVVTPASISNNFSSLC